MGDSEKIETDQHENESSLLLSPVIVLDRGLENLLKKIIIEKHSSKHPYSPTDWHNQR